MSDQNLDITAQCLLTFYNSAKNLLNNGLIDSNNVQNLADQLFNSQNDSLLSNNLFNLNKTDELSTSTAKNDQLYLIQNKNQQNLKTSSTKNNTTSSQLNSNDKKIHKCTFENCNKVYGKSSHLRAHFRVHTGERPFQCTWSNCQKSFSRSDELTRHYRIHTGEKNFECVFCFKRFSRRDHLTKHAKRHPQYDPSALMTSKKSTSSSSSNKFTNCTITKPESKIEITEINEDGTIANLNAELLSSIINDTKK